MWIAVKYVFRKFKLVQQIHLALTLSCPFILTHDIPSSPDFFAWISKLLCCDFLNFILTFQVYYLNMKKLLLNFKASDSVQNTTRMWLFLMLGPDILRYIYFYVWYTTMPNFNLYFKNFWIMFNQNIFSCMPYLVWLGTRSVNIHWISSPVKEKCYIYVICTY
jgi:hypothetical protein